MNAKDIARQRAVLGKRVKALKDLYASDDLSTEDYQREMVAVQERKRKLRALEKKLKDQETPNLPAVVEGKTDEGPRSSDPMVIGQPAKWSEEWWMKVSPQTQAKRCHAKNTKGQRCQRLAISGAKVCYTHGGAAPHVRAAALARLQNGSVDMADNLIRLAKHAGSEAVQLGATNSALDRAGVKTAAQVEVGPIKPHEQIFDDVLSGSYAESRRARGFEASESITEQRNSQIDSFGYNEPPPAPVDGADPVRSESDPSWRDGDSWPPAAPHDREPRRGRPSPFGVGVVTGEDAIRLANEQSSRQNPYAMPSRRPKALPPGRSARF